MSDFPSLEDFEKLVSEFEPTQVDSVGFDVRLRFTIMTFVSSTHTVRVPVNFIGMLVCKGKRVSLYDKSADKVLWNALFDTPEDASTFCNDAEVLMSAGWRFYLKTLRESP